MCLLPRRVKKNFTTLIFKINIICSKQFYAVNCQVCCDAQRRVTYLSAMCPGATPDILAHLSGPMHGAILNGRLNAKWQFIGDSAFPNDYEHCAMLTPFTRFDMRDAGTRIERDNYNYYLSQLRINIECCFGMLVNKFRVLTRALETTSLQRALLTFRVCCALHNFIIDDRIASNTTGLTTLRNPRGHRLVQVPVSGATCAEFAEVPQVLPDEDLELAMQSIDRMNVETEELSSVPVDDVAPSREEMVARIARSGYVRPRRYGVALHPYLCF